MKASITYQELQQLITEQTQQPISFEYVDPKTIKVNYALNLALLKKTIGINIEVLDLDGANLRLRYSDSGMDSLVGIALKLLKEKIPAGLIEELPNHELLVRLDSIEQIRPVFERIDVKDINMLSDAVEVEGDFKS